MIAVERTAIIKLNPLITSSFDAVCSAFSYSNPLNNFLPRAWIAGLPVATFDLIVFVTSRFNAWFLIASIARASMALTFTILLL